MKTKIALTVLVLSMSSALSAKAITLPAACGAEHDQLKVKTEKGHPLPDAPASGMARVVFIEALDGIESSPTVRFGLDGKWVAGAKGKSFVAVDVTPGMHSVCAAPQTGIELTDATVGVTKFNAVEGKTVFYELKITRSEIGPAGTHAAGQMLGYATPDMTAKRRDTVDTVSFTALDMGKTSDKLKKLPYSIVVSN